MARSFANVDRFAGNHVAGRVTVRSNHSYYTSTTPPDSSLKRGTKPKVRSLTGPSCHSNTESRRAFLLPQPGHARRRLAPRETRDGEHCGFRAYHGPAGGRPLQATDPVQQLLERQDNTWANRSLDAQRNEIVVFNN